MRVYAGHRDVLRYLEQRLGTTFTPPFEVMGFATDDGRPLAAALWNDMQPGGSIELTVAAEPGGITRGVIRFLAHYAFAQNGCRRVQIHIRRKNKELRKMLPRFGFTFEAVAPCFYATDDALVYRMLASTCRWIKIDELGTTARAA